MKSTTSTRAGLADPAQVVAAQVDEHQVLGALLGVGEQLVGERLVLLRRGAAVPGAGDGVDHGPPVLDLDQRLGARSRPTSNPSRRNRYMYGDGLVARSTR